MTIEKSIIDALKTIYDPEIPVDIYNLGLIYQIEVEQDSKVRILMTLTSPNCPVAESLPEEVMERGLTPEEVAKTVKYVFDLPHEITIPSIEVRHIKNY